MSTLSIFENCNKHCGPSRSEIGCLDKHLFLSKFVWKTTCMQIKTIYELKLFVFEE